MRIWHLYLDHTAYPRGGGYDSFSDHVVVAATEDDARSLVRCADECRQCREYVDNGSCVWCDPAKTRCEDIGAARDGIAAGVVCESFHAG